MRTSKVLDWILETILISLLCGTFHLYEWGCQKYGKPDSDPVQTLWIIGGTWIGIGLIRLVWRAIRRANTPPGSP